MVGPGRAGQPPQSWLGGIMPPLSSVRMPERKPTDLSIAYLPALLLLLGFVVLLSFFL